MARPLHLCEVLEQEHAVLYGGSTSVSVSWDVAETHVRDAALLAKRCGEAFSDQRFPANAAELAAELTSMIQRDDVLTQTYTTLTPKLTAELQRVIRENAGDGAEEVRHINRRIIDEVASEAALKPGPRARLEEYFARVHNSERPTSALCLSGGGIRSATFALGVLQGLARRNLLDKFDYISTVSGGGYIGSWLSSWIRRHPHGARGVAAELAARPADPLSPEPAPVAHLREYSNYLTPRLGMVSGDTWTVVATYVRNVLLNWTVLIPLMVLVVLLPRITAALYFAAPLNDMKDGTEAVPVLGMLIRVLAAVGNGGWIVRLAAGFPHLKRFVLDMQQLQMTGYMMSGTLFLFAALWYLGWNRPADNRFVGRRSSSDSAFIWRCLLPLTISGLILTAAWLRYTQRMAMPGVRHAIAPNTLGALRSATMLIVILTPVAIWIINLVNYLRADASARRENIAAEVRRGKVRRTIRKVMYEMMAAVLAGGLSYVLLRLLTGMIFPHPSRGLTLLAFPTPVLPVLETAPVAALYVCFAVPLFLATLFFAASIFVGLASEVNEDYDREWWGRCGGWVLSVIVAWPVVAATVIFGPVLIWFAPKIFAAAGGVTAVITVILGRSSKTGRRGAEDKPSYADVAARFLAPAVVVLIFATLSLLTSQFIWHYQRFSPLEIERYRGVEQMKWHVNGETFSRINGVPMRIADGQYAAFDRERANAWRHMQVFYNTKLPSLLQGAAVCLLIAAFAAGFIGVNKFSMHAMYRNRLIRAYLGASRATRDPNPFTGFDQHDNLALHILRPELLWQTSFANFQSFYNDLRHRPEPFYRNLRAAVNARRSGLLKRDESDESVREALFQVLNCVMEEEDFLKFQVDEPATPTFVDEVRASIERTWRYVMRQPLLSGRRPELLQNNRAELEKHFPVSLYPTSTPLLAPADVVSPQNLLKAFEQTSLGRKLVTLFNTLRSGEPWPAKKYCEPANLARTLSLLNELMVTVKFTDHLSAAAPKPRATPLKQRHVVNNRRYLEKHLGEALHKLSSPRPMHITNAALNLVAGRNLAWQERKAESFTFSPLHSGSYRLGYRPTVEYGGQTGVTLGTAMTISGAAASPNMGYHTAPSLSFLMTLFNVRLGWWLGNPGVPGKSTFHRDSPLNALMPLIAEATGRTNDTYSYVYLSDGGHFENLGLYEMVLRRRRYIFISDAGCDPKHEFQDLGNAIRKIRTDLGIPIEIDEPIALHPRPVVDETAKYCATGRIRYSCVDAGAEDGFLLYIKPTVYLREPKDIYNYARISQSFPHESTADQFFTESQFESYRMLGSHTIDQIVEGAAKHAKHELAQTLSPETAATWTAPSVDAFFKVARTCYLDQQRENEVRVEQAATAEKSLIVPRRGPAGAAGNSAAGDPLLHAIEPPPPPPPPK
jgi:hypothetical protein